MTKLIYAIFRLCSTAVHLEVHNNELQLSWLHENDLKRCGYAYSPSLEWDDFIDCNEATP